jgi:surfeit locus 1 family protein
MFQASAAFYFAVNKPPLSLSVASVVATILVLVVAGVCIRLGFWQLSRLQQRRASNAAIATRLTLPVIDISSTPHDTAALLYRRVRIAGAFDTAHAFALAGRSLRGNPGVYVFTPLTPAGGGTALLINRGWMPSADATSVNLSDVAVPSEKLTGVLMPFPPADNRRDGPPGFRRVLFRLNDGILPRFPYRVLPAYVQAVAEPGAPASPVRLPPPELNDGPHLGYAIQWFCFALIALVGWTIIASRARSPKIEMPGD